MESNPEYWRLAQFWASYQGFSESLLLSSNIYDSGDMKS